MDGNLYLLGDFNSAVSRTLDRTYNRNRQDEDKELHSFMSRSDTIEVWRTLHGNKVEVSYMHPVASYSIDMCLISSEIKEDIFRAEYIPSFSDHKILKIEMKMGEKLIGNDFVKIKPHVVQHDIFHEAFEGFWWEQKKVFIII